MAEKVRPKMQWDSNESSREGVVWWARLDGRYQVEVQRVPQPPITPDGVEIPDAAHSGMLYIFDHQNDDLLVHSESVGISYGAPFGPDVADVAVWQERAVAFVDGRPEDDAAK